ncbi:3-deoxy-8-phosphooctulonate synthase [bacterium]|nr:3-deoxy-8-phosphooctulonate synthase [bacterium]MBU1652328.1 3-deoxy-8-phosphooctulonate synthase [bacterium]
MLTSILNGEPFLIAGPCALETEEITLQVAARLKTLSTSLEIPIVFKGSYAKSNRTSESSFHGIGLDLGLEWLKQVKQQFGLPVTSDVHELDEIQPAAEVLDIIQIPSLLCKNTNLLHAAGETGKIVNIKKGHFVTAEDMRCSLEKVTSRGNDKIMITERGTQFGYGDMIVDFRSIATLKSFGFPVIFDASHSVRNTSRRSEDAAGGTPQSIPLLTRCAAAAGADGLFVETHPSPQDALCDAVSSYPLIEVEKLVRTFLDFQKFARQQDRLNSEESAATYIIKR